MGKALPGTSQAALANALGRLRDSNIFVSAPLTVAELEAGLRMLDIGCGSGRLLFDLRQLGFRVFGVHYSSSMVAASRALLVRMASAKSLSGIKKK